MNNSLLIVLPYHSGDASQLSSNLIWMKDLDGKLPYECLLSTDIETPLGHAQGWASRVFSKVHTYQYPRVKETAWPWPQNNAFMQTAWHVMAKFKCPWLWVETDSIPTRAGWIDLLWEEYKKGGKPFGGHLNRVTNVFNGVCIYPADIPRYSTRCMTATLLRNADGKQPPWDVYASKQVVKHLHVMNDLMQHEWVVNGQPATFPDAESVSRIIRPNVCLFHRVKDGTLIKQLRKMKRKPECPTT